MSGKLIVKNKSVGTGLYKDHVLLNFTLAKESCGLEELDWRCSRSLVSVRLTALWTSGRLREAVRSQST